jgi:hypothetical protein
LPSEYPTAADWERADGRKIAGGNCFSLAQDHHLVLAPKDQPERLVVPCYAAFLLHESLGMRDYSVFGQSANSVPTNA